MPTLVLNDAEVHGAGVVSGATLYVGGQFTCIGDDPATCTNRGNLAHILAKVEKGFGEPLGNVDGVGRHHLRANRQGDRHQTPPKHEPAREDHEPPYQVTTKIADQQTGGTALRMAEILPRRTLEFRPRGTHLTAQWSNDGPNHRGMPRLTEGY